jgi:undecaprenyl-diphosphatase
METLFFNFNLRFLQRFVILQNWDIELLRHINLSRLTVLDRFFVIITNTAAVIAYGFPLCLLAIGLLKHMPALKKNALYIFCSVVVAQIFTEALKYTVGRDRSFLTYPFIINVTEAQTPSFPSGHTTDAFALVIALCLVYRRWYIIVPAYLWACAVGYSRMDLGVHYPSDIIGSILVSLFTAVVLYMFYQQIISRKSAQQL